ncbi:glycerophosphodiester phosphodiesterase [Cohnella abietis]|uniref:GP-PDE domain-containing protein n=1 Tax=Cohnella abietis TaxID=2507935 RepID=A0A3T1DE35_9BACL|nr:glycerophosphodiester phosphodiesterase [Cohnella abietis]BBI36367.1 hypothetical protein KCTCHS21_57660 [Cohnella abietis]
MSQTLIAAHTGSGVHPDNTMASFLEGLELGADILEVDVRVTQEDTAILLHDDSPYLQTYSYEQLNEPDVRIKLDPIYKDHEIAKLEQILRVSEPFGTKLNLDLKTSACIDSTVQLIRQFAAQDRTFITGCSESITMRYPDIQVMMNTPDELSSWEMVRYDEFVESMCNQARQGGYTGLNMNGLTCLPEIVNRAHEFDLKVWVYTINERRAMEWFLEMQVDAITTREPKMLMNIIRSMK